jgi:uncharacterized membrane protein
MDQYKLRIKNRMVFQIIGFFLFVPLAVYALIRYWNTEIVISGTTVKDFIGGALNGIRGGVIIGYALFLLISFIKNMIISKNKEKLNKMYFEEYDERVLAISEHSSRVTFYIAIYLILAASVITGLYNATISLTLLAVWVFLILIRVVTLNFYHRKM